MSDLQALKARIARHQQRLDTILDLHDAICQKCDDTFEVFWKSLSVYLKSSLGESIDLEVVDLSTQGLKIYLKREDGEPYGEMTIFYHTPGAGLFSLMPRNRAALAVLGFNSQSPSCAGSPYLALTDLWWDRPLEDLPHALELICLTPARFFPPREEPRREPQGVVYTLEVWDEVADIPNILEDGRPVEERPTVLSTVRRPPFRDR